MSRRLDSAEILSLDPISNSIAQLPSQSTGPITTQVFDLGKSVLFSLSSLLSSRLSSLTLSLSLSLSLFSYFFLLLFITEILSRLI